MRYILWLYCATFLLYLLFALIHANLANYFYLTNYKMPRQKGGVHLNVTEKLSILADSAKYDVACTAGVAGNVQRRDNSANSCICHSFAADGRCISLIKVLLSNACIYNCTYCVNRSSNDIPRASFTPDELADLVINFYRRNYIEGLFLSSAVVKNPDYTMEQMIKALEIIRKMHNFRGYIHAKTIPGASVELVTKLGMLADRLSVNIELPSEKSLNKLAPDKSKSSILAPMRQVYATAKQNKAELVKYKSAPLFAPAGQSTQMIIGASDETDYQILRLSQGLYNKYSLKRVFFSAYIPVADNPLLPSTDTKPPLLREHRLYQADWLLRFYNFTAEEILTEDNQNFNPYLDPKCDWAIRNMHLFPVDINKCSKDMLLRVPGIGYVGASRIINTRKHTDLTFDDLKRLGVVVKRAQYFIVCKGYTCPIFGKKESTVRALIDPKAFSFGFEQMSMLDTANAIELPMIDTKNTFKAIKLLKKEAASCLSAQI